MSGSATQRRQGGSKFKAYFRRGEIFLSFFCRHLETGRSSVVEKTGNLLLPPDDDDVEFVDIYLTQDKDVWYAPSYDDCCTSCVSSFQLH